MAEASVFEWVSGELESRAGLSRLEARGTVRLLLKDAGLDPNTVRPHQMQVVVSRLMPSALKKRGVQGADGLCHALTDDLLARKHTPDAAAETAYDVFERLDSESTSRQKR